MSTGKLRCTCEIKKSVLIRESGDCKHPHWLVYSGANCWLLPSDTSWEVSVAKTGEFATPVICSVTPVSKRGISVPHAICNNNNGIDA